MAKSRKETAITKSSVPQALPVLPLRNAVFFPHQVTPLSVGRAPSIRAIEEAARDEGFLVIVAQTDGGIELPQEKDIHWVGTLARVLKVFTLADGTRNVLVQGVRRVQLISVLQTEPFLHAVVRDVEEPADADEKIEAMATNLKSQFRKAVELSPNLTEEQLSMVLSLEEPGAMTDMIASMIPVSVAEKQDVLEAAPIRDRMEKLTLAITKLLQKLELGSKIQSEVQDGINKTQREYYLREQMKAIRKELGEDEGNVEMAELRRRVEAAGLSEEARKVAEKELKRLEQMNQASAEYTVSRSYLDWILDLPWSAGTEDTLDIAHARSVLERDHYGLEKVKNRILEYLAVRKLKHDMRGPILVFVGPPGVGKTSLGRSIAAALGRKFVRMSLGGVHDEAEVRGHRRTYIGALPGRIIQGLKKAGSNNPVFMLDEIDKIGADFRGDPSSALLEVLDPEQNFSFSDHYLEIPFDLSKVMFIATANMIEPVPPALRDRMEIIEIPSYVEDEKLHIAKNFLIPKQVAEHGLTAERVELTDDAVRGIIAGYTRESGVRSLERTIARAVRGVAREAAEGAGGKTVIGKDSLTKYLGQQRFFPDVAERINRPGIAVGLAWTPVGGDILFIEATKMKGKGNLIVTGQLGDVMKESVQAALSFIAANAAELGVNPDFRTDTDIHVHVPAGAIPKDGPSAGVTMLTALTSLLSGRQVRSDLAMTGEITLRGAVLPIGGVKEKVLAAHRAGIKTIILPERNRMDLEDVPKSALAGDDPIRFHFVKEMAEVLSLALMPPGDPAMSVSPLGLHPAESN
ncbi:MAG TPA: endopeptidase La [Bacteroidota bacterium]|nr:endopeptidase La [Bacteroidota bacterium]